MKRESDVVSALSRNLPPYRERSPCSKCGCTSVTIAYLPTRDVLRRECVRCGHWWHEATVGTEAE